jgi:hypothetical protein
MTALTDWLAIRLLRWGMAIISAERFAELLALIEEDNAARRDHARPRHLTE